MAFKFLLSKSTSKYCYSSTNRIYLYSTIYFFPYTFKSLVAQTVKNAPAMQEIRIRHWVRKIPWKRKWQPILVILPGKSHGQRSLQGYSPWGHKKSDKTEWALTSALNILCFDETTMKFSLSKISPTDLIWDDCSSWSWEVDCWIKCSSFCDLLRN